MPKAYIDFEKELWDAANEPFEEKMEGLNATLLEQFEKGEDY